MSEHPSDPFSIGMAELPIPNYCPAKEIMQCVQQMLENECSIHEALCFAEEKLVTPAQEAYDQSLKDLRAATHLAHPGIDIQTPLFYRLQYEKGAPAEVKAAQERAESLGSKLSIASHGFEVIRRAAYLWLKQKEAKELTETENDNDASPSL